MVEYNHPPHMFKAVFEHAFRELDVAEMAMRTMRRPRSRASAKCGRKRALLKGWKERLREHPRYCATSHFPDDAARSAPGKENTTT
jgi:hypothetical protein